MKNLEELIEPQIEVYVATSVCNIEMEGTVEFLCPVTEKKDRGKYRIFYKPNHDCKYLELLSFIAWIQHLSTKILGGENFCELLYTKILDTISPDKLRVEVIDETTSLLTYKIIKEL